MASLPRSGASPSQSCESKLDDLPPDVIGEAIAGEPLGSFAAAEYAAHVVDTLLRSAAPAGRTLQVEKKKRETHE